jgi:hypothetical protein
MNYKNYIIFDVDDYRNMTMKVMKGFTRDTLKESLNVKDNWQEQGGDKLYFFPGCSVPRFKVREKWACTIKPSNATAAFVSDNMEGSDSTFYFYPKVRPVELYDIKYWIEDLIDDKLANRFANFIEHNTVDQIYLSKALYYEHNYHTNFHLQSVSLSQHFSNRQIESSRMFAYNWSEPQYQVIGINPQSDVGNMTCDIYHESDLLKILNEDQFVIDETKYDELRAFGNADDDENLVLMMELMSNCHYQKSLVHLVYLIKEFGETIQNKKESQHVNFKGLLTFLELDVKKIDKLDINDITRILRKHNKFTKQNVVTLSSLCSEDYINYADSTNVCWTKGPILKKACIDLIQKEEDDSNN